MRQIRIHRHFHAFGVDHHKLHFIRRCLVEEAHQHGVEAHAFARARRTGDEHMGHGGEIPDGGAPFDVLAEGHRQQGRGTLEGFRLDQLAEVDGGAVQVGDFHAHGIASRHRGLDTDGFGLEAAGKVVGQVGEPAHADARGGADFKQRDHRAGRHPDQFALNIEFGEAVHQAGALFLQHFPRGQGIALLRLLEQVQRRHGIGAFAQDRFRCGGSRSHGCVDAGLRGLGRSLRRCRSRLYGGLSGRGWSCRLCDSLYRLRRLLPLGNGLGGILLRRERKDVPRLLRGVRNRLLRLFRVGLCRLNRSLLLRRIRLHGLNLQFRLRPRGGGLRFGNGEGQQRVFPGEKVHGLGGGIRRRSQVDVHLRRECSRSRTRFFRLKIKGVVLGRRFPELERIPCVLFRRGGRFLRRQGEGRIHAERLLALGRGPFLFIMDVEQRDDVGGRFPFRFFVLVGQPDFGQGDLGHGYLGKALRQVVEREGRPAQLFSQQGPPLADKRDPRDAEGHLKGDEQQEQPDQGRPHRTEQGGELGIEAHAEHTSAPDVSDAEVPGRTEGNEASRQKGEAEPAPPRHGEPCGDAARSPSEEDEGPDKRGEPENIDQKPAEVRAEEPGVIFDDCRVAHGMVDAGVVLIKGHQAQEHQQSPENKKKPKQFPGDLASVRNGNLLRRSPFCLHDRDIRR